MKYPLKHLFAMLTVLLLGFTASFAEAAQIHFAIPDSPDEFTINYDILPGMYVY